MRLPKLFLLLPCLLVLLIGFLAFGGCSKEKSVAELIQDLNSEQEKDRLIAVRLLPQRKGDAAKIVPALIEKLNDKVVDVRQGAAIGLGSYGEEAKEAVPALQAALRDRDIRVREAATIALSRIDPNASPKTTPSKATK